MKAFALEGPCAQIAAALSRASTITFFYDQIFVKEPGTEDLTRWHQDQPYMAVDGQQLCSNWIPLDPITPETTLEFVRGSHRWGRWFAPFDSMLDGSRHPSAEFESCPDIEAAREDYDIVSWELEPGIASSSRGWWCTRAATTRRAIRADEPSPTGGSATTSASSCASRRPSSRSIQRRSAPASPSTTIRNTRSSGGRERFCISVSSGRDSRRRTDTKERAMSGDLVMVHTVAALADLFDELRAEIDPDVPVRHMVQAALLTDAIDAGALTDEIRARTRDALLEAAEGACVVLCTCSTVGPGADDAAAEAQVPILRVDRPMAEAAVEAGRRITVAATLATTIGPTAELVADAARRAGKEVEIGSVVFAGARARLVAGDAEGHERIIAEGLHEAASSADAIVLAQASMTPALSRCADIAIPLLTSPRSGLEAAIARWRAAA